VQPAARARVAGPAALKRALATGAHFKALINQRQTFAVVVVAAVPACSM